MRSDRLVLGCLLASFVVTPAASAAQNRPSPAPAADAERPPGAARWAAPEPPEPGRISPDTVLAIRYVAASLTIALSAGAIVSTALVDGHPPGEEHEWNYILAAAAAKMSVAPLRFWSAPRGLLPSNVATSLLDGTALPLVFAALGAGFGELTDRPRDVWFGAFVGASAFNLLNTPLVWDDRASDPASLWTSVGWGVATTAGGVTLALTEPGQDEAIALWVVTGLSAATTIHQLVWAIVGPPATAAPPPPRVALGLTGVGRSLGASLSGTW